MRLFFYTFHHVTKFSFVHRISEEMEPVGTRVNLYVACNQLNKRSFLCRKYAIQLGKFDTRANEADQASKLLKDNIIATVVFVAKGTATV